MMPIGVMKEIMSKTTPAERSKDMNEWRSWMAKYEDSFADMGGPLGKNKRITQSGVKEESNDVMGYSVVQAGTEEEVLAMLKENNHLTLPGAYMEVMEVKSM